METNTTSQFDSLGTGISEISKNFLRETAKWAYFLGILGFIFVGFMVLGSFSFGSLLSSLGPAAAGLGNFPGSAFTAIYLLMAAFYFFPAYYLFNFGKKTKQAFAENNNLLLEDAFKNLKSHYKFIGILVIILLSIYALTIIGIIIGGGVAAFS